MSYKSYRKGRESESLAAAFLAQQGYKVIEHNFHSPFGEIDLIAQDGQTLVFVEVRMRNKEDQVHPLETISREKQQRLIKTAQMYLATQKSQDTLCRFDVVAITEENGEKKIEIYRNMIEG